MGSSIRTMAPAAAKVHAILVLVLVGWVVVLPPFFTEGAERAWSIAVSILAVLLV